MNTWKASAAPPPPRPPAPLEIESVFKTVGTAKTVVVFPTAQLHNRKAMSYIVRMCYLYGNSKQGWKIKKKNFFWVVR